LFVRTPADKSRQGQIDRAFENAPSVAAMIRNRMAQGQALSERHSTDNPLAQLVPQ